LGAKAVSHRDDPVVFFSNDFPRGACVNALVQVLAVAIVRRYPESDPHDGFNPNSFFTLPDPHHGGFNTDLNIA
jgi:hypothetical protein